MAYTNIKSGLKIEFHPVFWHSKVWINDQQMKFIQKLRIEGDATDDMGLTKVYIEGIMLPGDDPIVIEGTLYSSQE